MRVELPARSSRDALMRRRWPPIAMALAMVAVLAGASRAPDAIRGSGSCTRAPFPSVLHTSGRTIVDAHGCTLPLLKGFSIQIGPWSQSTLGLIAAKGATIERLAVFWDDLQSTDCSDLSLSGQTYVSDIDEQLAWAQKAKIYTELDLHLLAGRAPRCAKGPSELDKYMNSGRWITQYLANRYGNTSSAHYTKDVIGFGLNEPPPDNTNAPNVNTILESDQSTMLRWIRGPRGAGGSAPQWIGFVAYGYASSTPIYNANPRQTNQCRFCANANPHAYDAIGGNVILDLHEYMMGCSNAWKSSTKLPASSCDGREYNGSEYTVANGGWQVNTGDSRNPAYPIRGESEATAQTQLGNFLYPYDVFSREADIPLMIGEFGWEGATNTTGGLNLIHDYMTSWRPAAPVIEMEWEYNVDQFRDPWAVDPGSSARGADPNGWLDFTNAFMTRSTAIAHAVIDVDASR